MTSLRTLFFFIITITAVLQQAPVAAQELKCEVEINSDQISGNKQIFETLESAINDYMNTTTFTNAQFAANEKIECRIYLTVKEYADDKFTGDMQVQLTRPIYNASLTTTLLNFKDTKIEFTYRENEPLVFSVNNMESQLTAILNFYAYLFIALDFDSFSPRGGTPYFERLSQIVQMAQSSGETGWKAFEDTKNRSAVLAAYTDPQTQVLRDLTYTYHRHGLDMMALSVDKGRAAVTESLDIIKKINEVNPMSVALSMFKDAKFDELVNIYSKAPTEERNKVHDLLSPIYPTEQERLEEIKKGAEQK